MKNEKLIKLNSFVKEKGARLARHGKRIAKISVGEDRKLLQIASFWVLTAVMIIISVIAVIYEKKILPGRVNYDSYDDETYYVTQEWIDMVTQQKEGTEKAIAENNMKKTSKQTLRANVKDMERQLELLEYLKANNIGLRLKNVENQDADYTYYIDGYAYRFDEISFAYSIVDAEGKVSQEKYLILPDERSGDSVFEANLIFYFVAVLLVVICFSDEFSTGTIKLVVSKPVSRREIGTAKLCSIATLLTLSVSCSMLIYTLFSLFFKNPVRYIAYIAGQFTNVSVMAFNLFIFIDILLVSLGFVAVSVFFAVRFKNNIVAVILPFIVYFFKSILVRVVPNLAVIDLFENLKLMEHFVLGNAVYGSTKVWQALLTSCGIMLVLMMLAIRRFRRYDMDKIK